MTGVKLTSERAVFAALRNTFERPAYAVLPGVANGTGSAKTRTIDAVFMSLWPSRGLTLHGVEIKVSRGDFTREIANPAKQEAHFKYLDHFWLAVGDASIVRDGELPATWGLLVPARTKLKVIKQAPLLKAAAMPRSMLAAILRRADEHIHSTELRAEIQREVEAVIGTELATLREESKVYQRQKMMMRHATMIDRFSQRSGVRFDDWNTDAVDRAADIVKAIGANGLNNLFNSLRYEAEVAKRLADRTHKEADELLAELAKLEAADPSGSAEVDG